MKEAERTHVGKLGGRAARRLAAAVVADSSAALVCTARHDEIVNFLSLFNKKRKKKPAQKREGVVVKWDVSWKEKRRSGRWKEKFAELKHFWRGSQECTDQVQRKTREQWQQWSV